MASRDEDKDLRESDDVRAMGFCQLWAKFLFFYRWGTWLCWQLSGDQGLQRQHAFTAHQSLGRNTLKPSQKLISLPRELQKTQH